MDTETIRPRIVASWEGFRASLGSLPFQRNTELLEGVLATTGRLREPFLQLRSEEPDKSDKKRRRRKDKRSGSPWYDCCDCNPCDGCDCCPCH